MSFNKSVFKQKQTIVYTQHRILLSKKKGMNYDTQNDLNRSQRHYAE